MHRTTATRWIALVLLASALLSAVPLCWGLPSTRGWAFDEITPTHVEPEMWPKRYPPGHRYVLRAIYVPVDALHRAGLAPRPLYQARFLAGRVLSVLMATLTIYLVYRIARVLRANRRSSLLAAALLAFGPTFAYYAKTANLDLPYLFWFALALLFFARVISKGKARDFFLFGVAGAFSFCIKDQAAFLYVLTPAALVWTVAAERVRSGADRWHRAVLPSLIDRRILLAAAGSLATFALAYRGVFGSVEFDRHFTVLTTGDYEAGRQHGNALAGYLSFTWQSVVNLLFAMSTPVVLAGLAGLVSVLVSKPRRWLALAPLVLVVPYQLGMMVLVGLAYDRHLLPIALVVAIFSGLALDRWLTWKRLSAAVRAAAVGAIIAWALARAGSFDALMIGDPRFAAEDWIEERQSEARIIGLGKEAMLPRGIRNVTVPFQPELVDRVRLEVGAFHDCWTLRALDADYLVPGHRNHLDGPGVNYEPRVRFENRFAGFLNKTHGAVTNLDKIPRQTTIWGRVGKPCIERAESARQLADLLKGRRSWSSDTANTVTAAGGPGEALGVNPIRVLRATRDYRTRGVDPVGLLVKNAEAYERSLELEVASAAPAGTYPITVSIRGPRGIERHQLEEPGRAWIPLPSVPPETTELFVLAVDKEWLNSGLDPRLVGVTLVRHTEPVAERRAFQRELSELAQGKKEIPAAPLIDRILNARVPGVLGSANSLAVAGIGGKRRLTKWAAVAARNPLPVPRAVVARLTVRPADVPLELRLTPIGEAGGTLASSPPAEVPARLVRLFEVGPESERLVVLHQGGGTGAAVHVTSVDWAPAGTRAELHQRLDALRRDPRAERGRLVREARLGRFEAVADHGNADEDNAGLALGLGSDGRIEAAQPAGLAVVNPGKRTKALELQVSCSSSAVARGMRIFADAGQAVRSHRCLEPGRAWLPLGAVPPSEERLVILWTEQARTPGESDGHDLGAQVHRFRWRRVSGGTD